MVARRRAKFEAQLTKLNEGLSRPGTTKKLPLVWERIGRFKNGSSGIGQHYEIEVVADPKQEKAVQVKWRAATTSNSMWTDSVLWQISTPNFSLHAHHDTS